MISKFLRILARIFFNAMFSGDDNWARHSSVVLSILEVYLAFKLIKTNVLYVLPLTSLLLIIYLASSHRYGFYYVLLVSSIPTLWYFFTSLPFTGSVFRSFYASMRAFVLGSWILTLIYFFNPMEASIFLKALTKSKEAQVFFPFVWRLVPHIINDLESSILANELKNEKTWKGLALTMVASMEYEKLYSESLVVKLRNFKPYYWYDRRGILMNSAIVVTMLLLLFLAPI